MHKRIKIGQLIKDKKAHSQTGPFGTQLSASEYVEEGFPVINVRNIGMGEIRKENLEFLTQEKALELKSHSLLENDIVFGRKGAVERHSLITKKEEGWIQGSDCIRLRFLTDEINPKFISYFFRTQRHQSWMINLGSFGATMGSLNQEIISKIEIPDITRKKQDKIASILSAYDDLIENNNQRIQLLEEMAEEIYKEWFVRLRFPGYQNTKIVDGVPEGWEKEKAEVFFNINIGKTPPRKEPQWFSENPNDEYWVSIKDINGSRTFIFETSEKITKDGATKFNMRFAPIGTVILSFKLTVGKVAITAENMLTNEAIAHFNTKKRVDIPASYTYWYLKLFKYGELGNTSSIGNAINSKIVKAMPFIKPSSDVLENFYKITGPMMEDVKVLVQKNQLLQQTRDLLLPHLMSGKLDINNINLEDKINLAAEPRPNYK